MLRWIARLTALTLALVSLAASCSRRPATEDPAGTVTIDFCAAAGISPEELSDFLDRKARQEGVAAYPVLVTLQNRQGDLLTDSRVIVRWDQGEYRLLVGSTSVIRFTLGQKQLGGLRIIAPAGYDQLRQRTIPLGAAYQPEEKIDTSPWDDSVVLDGELLARIGEQLKQIQDAGEVLSYEEFRSQLQRGPFPRPLDPPPSEELTTAEIYRRRKASVVVVANLFSDGQTSHGGGFVLTPDGLIVTAYHVVNKPSTVVARGVMLAQGTMYAVREVVAADRAADVAVLRIQAQDLPTAPLAENDPVGSAISVLSHPGHNFFSLTQGTISRYWAATQYGRAVVRMSITADFADGASGGPIFNSRGGVTGIVSSTEALGDQMVVRVGVPVQAIRDLVPPPQASLSIPKSPPVPR